MLVGWILIQVFFPLGLWADHLRAGNSCGHIKNIFYIKMYLSKLRLCQVYQDVPQQDATDVYCWSAGLCVLVGWSLIQVFFPLGPVGAAIFALAELCCSRSISSWTRTCEYLCLHPVHVTPVMQASSRGIEVECIFRVM